MNVADAAHRILPEPPWGSLIAIYFVLIGLPSGLTLMSWWLRREGDSSTTTVERYSNWIALAGLLVAGALLIADLGRPFRFYLMLTRFDNLGSPIAVGAKLIAVKVFVLAVILYAMRRRRPTVAAKSIVETSLAWILVATSFALALYPASVLARSWASPLAHTSGAAVLFALTALLMGAAVTILIVAAIGADRQLPVIRHALLALLGFFCVALVFEGLSLGSEPADRRIMTELISGDLATTFWALIVGVGVAVPATCLSAFPNRRGMSVLGATAVIVGTSATRYLIFVAGR